MRVVLASAHDVAEIPAIKSPEASGVNEKTPRLRRMNPRWRYSNINQPRLHVIDEAGNKPLPRQCGYRSQQSNIDGHCCAGIADRFSLEFRFLYLKIAGQHRGIADESSDAAISVLEYDEVKLAAASRNLSRNLTDSPE